MRQPHAGDGIGHPLRFVRIEGARHTGLHIAEGAGPRAGVAHDHEGRVFLRPAFAAASPSTTITVGFCSRSRSKELCNSGASGRPAGAVDVDDHSFRLGFSKPLQCLDPLAVGADEAGDGHPRDGTPG